MTGNPPPRIVGLARALLPPLAHAALGLLPPLALLGLWAWAGRGSAILPGPGEVGAVLARPLTTPAYLDAPSLAHCALISLLRVACGFLLAILTAVPLGLAIGRSDPLRRICAPTLSFLMVISPIAWIPLAILVLGLTSPATALFGDDAWRHPTLGALRFAVVGIVWLGAFFSITLATAAGARGVRRPLIDSVRAFGASRWQIFRVVILPASLPGIVTGIRVGGGIAWRVIIAAEIFPGTRSGLGYVIATSQDAGVYQYAFAAIVVIGVLGLLLDGGLHLLERRIGRWQGEATA